ncbi:MAG: transposase [Magnetococcales bacterium]|nr:transposase [Magnetococcales bacterium]MBF0113563.1 transposase [Magnetococcales bacterium]
MHGQRHRQIRPSSATLRTPHRQPCWRHDHLPNSRTNRNHERPALYTLQTIKLIKKPVQPIPPHHCNVIRHYGLLASRVKTAYTTSRQDSRPLTHDLCDHTAATSKSIIKKLKSFYKRSISPNRYQIQGVDLAKIQPLTTSIDQQISLCIFCFPET